MLFAKEKRMSFFDFHAELLNYDLMQKFHSQSIQPEAGPYALYTDKNDSKLSKQHQQILFFWTLKNSGTSSSQFFQSLPHLPPLLSAIPIVLNSRLRSPCQICKQEGHQTLNCFNLMNYSF